jgi:hypothetical protein
MCGNPKNGTTVWYTLYWTGEKGLMVSKVGGSGDGDGDERQFSVMRTDPAGAENVG